MNREQYHQDLVEVVKAVEVLSATQFKMHGQVRDAARIKVVSRTGYSLHEESLLQALESELYQCFYCRPRAGSVPAAADPAAARDFIGALSRANCGSGTWESGWLIAAVEPDGRVAVRRDGVTFWAKAPQVRCAGGAPGPAMPCEVRLEKEIRHLYPAFYMALGNALPDCGPLLRFYWHLTPVAAVRYMALVTERLNQDGIPFKTKVLSNPNQYLRADAGVLYVNRGDFARLRPIIKLLYADLRTGLNEAVPMFTKRLAPGLGLADDPGGGLSFGQSRCRVAAEGLYRCWAEGLHQPEERLRRLAEVFREKGLDPLRPYLAPGSADHYTIDLTP